VLVSKYADHQLLYRQPEIYAREGGDRDRSTLAGWVGATSELLTLLIEVMPDCIVAASKLHADDTPVPVLEPGNRKTRTGRLLTYVRNDRFSSDTTAAASVHSYISSSTEMSSRPMLRWASIIFTNQERSTSSHARRKFHKIHFAHVSPTTSEAIEHIAAEHIAALYAIEAEICGGTPEIRKTIRQARARPLFDGMRTWLEAVLAKLPPKSDTAAAIRYALSRWRTLTRYVDDGHLEIDNNAAACALRIVALNRKNFLFAGSDAIVEHATAMYPLLDTANRNVLDTEIYLQQVLERIADYHISKIIELLQCNLLAFT
jgi:hypothetical protein